MQQYRDPQPMYYNGVRYGARPFTQIQPGAGGVPDRGILWDQPIKRIPADRVDGLLADGFLLALLVPEAARRYDVAQEDIRTAVDRGLLLEAEDRGEHYVIFDPAARKRVAAIRSERLDGERRNTTKGSEA